MNNEELLEHAKTLTAKANGVECEKQWKQGLEPPWKEWDTALYDPIHWRYRVKPEPPPVVTEWWVNIYPSGAVSLHPTPERAREEAARDATDAAEVAVHVVRADSIKLADLVTEEQICAAITWLRENFKPYAAESVDGVISALDKVREAADEN